MEPRDHLPGRPHHIAGPGGITLHARAWGNPDAPAILFLHGWSSAGLAFRPQTDSTLRDHFHLVALDLRGHGWSDKPTHPAAYQSSDLWADDLAAVIAALRLRRPVLVAWSYAGLVVCDYLARHGTQNIAAVNFVGASVIVANPPVHVGPRFLAAVRVTLHDDPAIMIDGLRQVQDVLTLAPQPPRARERAIAAMALASPAARAHMLARTLDGGPILRRLDRPCLVTHGADDQVILPPMADYIVAHAPQARLSLYQACGHTPHQEYATRFNTELAALAA